MAPPFAIYPQNVHAIERLFVTFSVELRTRAVSTVDRPVGVEKESGPRQIVVELKKRQIHTIGLYDANTHELIE